MSLLRRASATACVRLRAFNGGDGANLIFGGFGDNSILTGSGNDTIWANEGNDTIAGGAGADRYVFLDRLRQRPDPRLRLWPRVTASTCKARPSRRARRATAMCCSRSSVAGRSSSTALPLQGSRRRSCCDPEPVVCTLRGPVATKIPKRLRSLPAQIQQADGRTFDRCAHTARVYRSLPVRRCCCRHSMRSVLSGSSIA